MMLKQYMKRLTTKLNERAHNIFETKLHNNNKLHFSSVISVVMIAAALITFDNTI